jgi:hypothetical protein
VSAPTADPGPQDPGPGVGGVGVVVIARDVMDGTALLEAELRENDREPGADVIIYGFSKLLFVDKMAVYFKIRNLRVLNM